MIRSQPAGRSTTFAFSAAGFIATSTSGLSPGVFTWWSAKCSWNAETPGRVPAGALISAGKSGNDDRSLPNSAVSDVKRSPVSCMPSPESPAKRMMTHSRCSTCLDTVWPPCGQRTSAGPARTGSFVTLRPVTTMTAGWPGGLEGRRAGLLRWLHAGRPARPGRDRFRRDRVRRQPAAAALAAHRGQAADLLVGRRSGRRGLGSEPGPLLRLCLSLCGLRRGRGLPLPLGHGLRRARLRRSLAGRDVRLPRPAGHRAALRVAEGGADMGVDVQIQGVGVGQQIVPKPIRFVLNWGRRYSLWVFNFGLACCAIEFIATSMARHDFIRLGVIPFAPGPRQADLMVVSGTVTDKMAPAIRRLYDQMPEPKYVISFGACSNSGGPYWDSYSVTKGVDQIVPVDVYVPGCPPRPEALLHGIIRLQEQIAGERLSAQKLKGRYAGTRVGSAGDVRRPLLRRGTRPEPPAPDGAAR